MTSGSVPISLDGFRVERNDDVVLFGDPLQNVPGHPQLVGRVDPQRRPDLKFRLARHHFQIHPADVHFAVEARPAVRVCAERLRTSTILGVQPMRSNPGLLRWTYLSILRIVSLCQVDTLCTLETFNMLIYPIMERKCLERM